MQRTTALGQQLPREYHVTNCPISFRSVQIRFSNGDGGCVKLLLVLTALRPEQCEVHAKRGRSSEQQLHTLPD